MTQRSLRSCKQRLCSNLTRDYYAYCDEHLPSYLEKLNESKKKRMKKYDDKRKGENYRA